MILDPSTKLKDSGILIGIGGLEGDFRQAHGEDSYHQSLDQVLKFMDCVPKRIYHANQVHGKKIVKVDKEIEPSMMFAQVPMFDQTDGLVTGRRGDALLVRMVDCTPLVLFDPVQRVLGTVHSGWKSTVQEISLEAIRQMEMAYGTKRSDLLVYLGPSIGKMDYQVGLEVYEAFEGIGNRKAYFDFIEGHYYLDMIRANIQVLLNAGLKPDQLEWSQESTYSSTSLHSARREGQDYGLNALIAYLP